MLSEGWVGGVREEGEERVKEEGTVGDVERREEMKGGRRECRGVLGSIGNVLGVLGLLG